MKKSVLALSLASIGLLAACATGGGDQPVAGAAFVQPSDLGRQVLHPTDGWAAAAGAVTGGAKASPEFDITVSNRKEFVAALNKAGKNPEAKEPRIIRVKGTINLSSDDSGRELTEKDYAVAPYNFGEYMKTYAPAVWNVKPLIKGRPDRKLKGPQEEARKASVKKQREQIYMKLPSNTTIVGLGKDAKIIKGSLVIGAGVENVIIRNIEFQDAFDYFPGWDPGDSFKVDKSYPGCTDKYVDANTGPQKCPGGRWNSEYDLIEINGGKRVWIDHCSFSDGDRPDSMFPPVYPFPQNEITQKIQHHDGLIDVTNQADLVTISNNYFRDHDKAFLVGSSDSKTADAGHLRVTLHNNYFNNVGQRMPRVRYGQVHSYNNYFVGNAQGEGVGKTAYERHMDVLKNKPKHNVVRNILGAGQSSAIYSEANVFEIANGTAAHAASNMKAKAFFDQGSMFNGKLVNLLEEANKASGKPMSPDVGWKPALYGANKVKPAAEVPAYVKANAGAGKL